MRKALLPVTLLMIGLLVAACGGGGGGAPSVQTYAVSGVVKDTTGQPIQGVSLTASGITETTGANGTWRIAGLKGTVTISVVHSDYEFSPAESTFRAGATDVQFVGSRLYLVGADGDYTSIQAAIDDAGDGGTIVVSEGMYNENLEIGGKAVTLRSAQSARARPVIKASDDSLPVIFIGGGSNHRTIIEGLEITGGIRGIDVGASGRGFEFTSKLTLRHNEIIENENQGAVLFLGGDAEVLILGNVIKDNSWTGIQLHPNGAMVDILENSISDNEVVSGAGGAGLYIGNTDASGVTVSANKFERNTVIAGNGGAIYIWYDAGAVTVIDNTFVENVGGMGGAIYIDNMDHSFVTRVSSIVNGSGGLIVIDPDGKQDNGGNTYRDNQGGGGDVFYVK